MKLLEKANTGYVTPAEMKDGQIGIIRNWSPLHHKDKIVQKYGDSLIALGMPKGNSFGAGGTIDTDDCQIEILPPGTKLEI